MTAPSNFAGHFSQLPFDMRVHTMTMMRGAAFLASSIFPSFRALALHFQTIEQIGSLVSLPEIVRAYVIDEDLTEGSSLTLMHSVRFLKSIAYGTNVKFGLLFLDLLKVIDSIGRVLGTWVAEARLAAAYEDHHRFTASPGSFRNAGGDTVGYTEETYLLTKKVEMAMYVAAIGALTVPFLPLSSAYAPHIMVAFEVSYAALSLLHYFYQAHAQDYRNVGSAGSGGGDGGDGPYCDGGKGEGKGGALDSMTDSLEPQPAPRQATPPPPSPSSEESSGGEPLVESYVAVGEGGN